MSGRQVVKLSDTKLDLGTLRALRVMGFRFGWFNNLKLPKHWSIGRGRVEGRIWHILDANNKVRVVLRKKSYEDEYRVSLYWSDEKQGYLSPAKATKMTTLVS